MILRVAPPLAVADEAWQDSSLKVTCRDAPSSSCQGETVHPSWPAGDWTADSVDQTF